MSTTDANDDLSETERRVYEIVRDKLESFDDDAAWVHVLTDHVAFETDNEDGAEFIDEREAEDIIRRLQFRGHLQFISDDMWMDDKVTLPLAAQLEEMEEPES